MNPVDYYNLLRKGYTHELIRYLMRYDPERFRELVDDPWAFPFVGDRSAPVERNPRANPRTRTVIWEGR